MDAPSGGAAARPGWRALAFLGLVAFALRLLPVAVLGPERYATRGYLYYEEMADNVLAGRGLVRTMPYGQGERHAIRTPGYPLLVAALKAAPGNLTAKIALCGALFGAASVLLTALVASRAFGARAGLVAGALLAAWPHAVVHDAAMQDTALYTAALLGSVALAQRLRDRPSWSLAVAWGALAAGGVLVRATLLPAVVVLAAWVAACGPSPARRRLAVAGVMLAALAAGLAPWLARNARVVGAPVLVSDGGRSLWLGNNPETFSVYPRMSIDRAEERAWAALSDGDRARVRGLAGRELEQDAWFRERALAHVRAHPGAALAGFARKIAATFSPWMSPRAAPLKQGIHLVAWGGALALGLAGAWAERRRWRELVPLWSPVVLLALHSGAFFGHSAYRAYADALVLVFAAVPLARRLRTDAPRMPAAPLLLALALALRLAALVSGSSLELPARPWERGYEVGAVARAIADGRGFADPFDGGEGPTFARTGPTAAVGPLLPLAWGAMLRACGDEALAWRLVLVACAAASALVAPLLAWGGASLGVSRAGVVAGLAWAVHPFAVLAVSLLLPSVFPLLATWAFLEMLRLHAGAGSWPRTGLAIGVSAWAEPHVLAIAVAWVLVFGVARRARRREGDSRPLFALGLACVLVAPWIVRNAGRVGVVQVRSWAGPELLLGAAAGPGDPTPLGLHPTRSPEEMRRLLELGEAGYVRDARSRALELARERPARWVAACAWRWGTFWLGRASWWRRAEHPLLHGAGAAARGALHAGVALAAAAGLVALARRRDPVLPLLVLVLVLYPMPHALGHVEARYRLPVEPLLLLVAALGLSGHVHSLFPPRKRS